MFALSLLLAGSLIVHEWGTFTSVSRPDGTQTKFSVDIGKDLPSFVYQPAFGKNGVSLQRMETPVTYFYTDEERTLDVEIGFPNGAFTEVFPRPSRFALQAMSFRGLRLLPGADVALPQLCERDDPAATEHYMYARDTASAIVRTDAEHEKFIFYRGTGDFDAPLRLQVLPEGLMLRNEPVAGVAYPLGRAFTLEVSDDRKTARFMRTDAPAPAAGYGVAISTCELRPIGEVSSELAVAMQAELVAAGLYADEAAAMVKTWRSSWFEEPGVRVLYLLPQSFTDAVLPLTVRPAPDETVRVLLGRAEVLKEGRASRFQVE